MGSVLENQPELLEKNQNVKKCLLHVSTINCHFRLPTTFQNLHDLFVVDSPQFDGRPIEVYCINLQQIVYRGKRTFFSGDAE